MDLIVLKRARAAAKSMTPQMFDANDYGGKSECPRCLAGHLIGGPFYRGVGWMQVYERLVPVIPDHPYGWSASTKLVRCTHIALCGHSLARRELAHILRVCRKYQRRRRMAILRDELKQSQDRARTRARAMVSHAD